MNISLKSISRIVLGFTILCLIGAVSTAYPKTYKGCYQTEEQETSPGSTSIKHEYVTATDFGGYAFNIKGSKSVWSPLLSSNEDTRSMVNYNDVSMALKDGKGYMNGIGGHSGNKVFMITQERAKKLTVIVCEKPD